MEHFVNNLRKATLLQAALCFCMLLTCSNAIAQDQPYSIRYQPTSPDTAIEMQEQEISLKQVAPSSAHCNRTSEVYNTFFKNQASYVPANSVTTPATVVKEVKIRFVVAEQDNTGSVQKNFRPSNVQDLYKIVAWLNDMMSRLAQPQNPVSAVCGSCYVADERIRVKLVGVDFINDTTKYIYQQNTTLLKKYGKDQDRILNIYLYVDSSRWRPKINPNFFTPGAWSDFGGALTGPDKTKTLSIYMFNTYLCALSYPQVDENSSYDKTLWQETRRLMHELHHCLGLGHLQKDKSGNYGFDPGGCSGADFLADAYPNGCPMSYADDTTNNIMNTSHWSNYLSPLQVGRVNRSAFLGAVSKYLYPTEKSGQHPWVIDSSQVWDFPIRMFQDIIIRKGDTLTVQCTLQMPAHANIIIKKGGRLIVDGGRITAYHKQDTWGGIQYRKGEEAVVLKNNAVIEYVE